ncbi:phage baseplate assembly protein [Vibrio sp.]|uniref:phage baseplate assembly protein n=1 Tax=Vibrio sp. TaxID=678 RepID=UPI003AA9D96D
MDKVTLKVDGKVYEGWTKVQVTRALDAMAGSFELSLTSKWMNNKYQAVSAPIQQGEACVVEIGGERVITGYIDDWIPSYDDEQITISVSGRAKTADLVDCSVVHSSGQFNNQTLTQIARTVCKPFGIDVVVNTDVGAAFQRVQLEQGETAHELLARLAKQRGVLLTSDTFGNLVITRTSKEKAGTALILGQNVLAARGRFSWRDRFSQFTVKSTGPSFGEKWDGAGLSSVGGIKAEITDEEITRYRPMIIINEEIATADGASKRGQWERQRSIARSNSAEYTVTGWRIPDTGKLWNFNQLIQVTDQIFGIDKELLIKAVMFSEDESGRLSVISVVPKEAMDIPAQAEKKTKVAAKW